MAYGKCFICGRYGTIERHHIFGGALRKKSDRLGLVVDLCHECHNEPPYGAHHCRATSEQLKQFGQRKAMIDNRWTVDDFVREFGKNYLNDAELADVEEDIAYDMRHEAAESNTQWTKVKPVKVKQHNRLSAEMIFKIEAEVLPF